MDYKFTFLFLYRYFYNQRSRCLHSPFQLKSLTGKPSAWQVKLLILQIDVTWMTGLAN